MEDSVSIVKRAGIRSARSGNKNEDWLSISEEKIKSALLPRRFFCPVMLRTFLSVSGDAALRMASMPKGNVTGVPKSLAYELSSIPGYPSSRQDSPITKNHSCFINMKLDVSFENGGTRFFVDAMKVTDSALEGTMLPVQLLATPPLRETASKGAYLTPGDGS
jgi:hypothetical protein